MVLHSSTGVKQAVGLISDQLGYTSSLKKFHVATDSHSSFASHCDRCTDSHEEKVGSHLDILRPLKSAVGTSMGKPQRNAVDKQYHKTLGLLCGKTLPHVKAITVKTESHRD